MNEFWDGLTTMLDALGTLLITPEGLTVFMIACVGLLELAYALH